MHTELFRCISDNHPLLGIAWQGSHFLDRALPFGLRLAPKIFNAVADLLAWSLHFEGILLLIHYLDDLFFGPPSSGIAAHSVVEGPFDGWGIPIAHHKTEGTNNSPDIPGHPDQYSTLPT